jgi:RNA polymerase sigma-70 factor (ECF subfamily)
MDQKDRAVGTRNHVTVQAFTAERPELAHEVAPRVSIDRASVFAHNVQFVARTLRHFGVPDADLEDVCQEVFLVVYRRLVEFEGRAALRTWIYEICWRTAQAHRRRLGRDAQRNEPLAGEPHVDPQQPAELERVRMRERLRALLDELDDDKRAVFVLYEIEELSLREVAEIVGSPLQTVYSRLKAARAVVRETATRLGLCEGDES